MISAVLFDFDGVVVQSEKLHMKTFIQMLEGAVDVDEKRWYSEFAGTGSRYIFSVLLQEAGIDKEKVPEYVEARKKIYAERVLAGELEKTPGIDSFLDYLESLGIERAVVSGGHQANIKTALSVTELDSRFTHIIGAEDVDKRKPDPEGYLKGAGLLGAEPKDCLGIEDSPAGSEAVKSAGMRLVVVDSPASGRISGYDALIKDFTEFPKGLIE
jgi:beta-phosphoglucomutase